MKKEEIFDLINKIAQYQNNPAQVPLRQLQDLTSALLGPKSRALCAQIGGESIVIKVVDEFSAKVCLKVPRIEILQNAPKRNVAVLKNLVNFARGAGAEIENINAERFSQGAVLQRDIGREALTEGIKHFVIPPVLKISSEPILHYVMEWFDCPAAIRCLKEKGDILYSLEIFKKILYATNFLHVRGIIHRDWKSDNLLVNENDNVVILDWTMAKVKNDRNLTIPGSVGGTSGFAPAKFIADGDFKLANYTDDLYLLGFVLWEFITLQKLPPLPREQYTDAGILAYRKELVTFLPEVAQPIFWHSTEQDECERFQSAKEFLEGIRRLEEVFAKETGFMPTSQTLTPTLVLEQPVCHGCGACGGVKFCELLADFIRKIR